MALKVDSLMVAETLLLDGGIRAQHEFTTGQ